MEVHAMYAHPIGEDGGIAWIGMGRTREQARASLEAEIKEALEEDEIDLDDESEWIVIEASQVL